MTWAQRLKRVFGIDFETCLVCCGAVRIIVCIEDPVVIKKILSHLDRKDAPQQTGRLPEGRAPHAVCPADVNTPLSTQVAMQGTAGSRLPKPSEGPGSEGGEGGFFHGEDGIGQYFEVVAGRMAFQHS
jgi:hypothetical protein